MSRRCRMCRGVVLIGLVAAAVWWPTVATAQQGPWPSPIHDDQLYWFLIFDKLEITSVDSKAPVVWDAEGWVGNDFNRVWLKAEGERALRGGAGEFEVQALYSRLIAPYWDLQAGVRYDRRIGPGPGLSRVQLVLGLEGLAPYWFELEPALFISDDGDISARLTASYDLLLTQRLILQPWFEVNVAAQTVQEWGIGSGLEDVSVELRLRYEFRRELAPYLGVGWFQRVGRTAEIARTRGRQVVELSVLGGFRLWF